MCFLQGFFGVGVWFLGIHLGIHGIGIFTYAYKALIISSVDVPLDSHEKSWTPKLFLGGPSNLEWSDH